MALSISLKNIEKYFSFLFRMDNSTKRELIKILSDSLNEDCEKPVSLKQLAGAWEDSRDSDQIIQELKESRIEKNNNISFD